MTSKRAKRLIGNFGMLLAPIGAILLAELWLGSSPTVASVDAGATSAQPASLKVEAIALDPKVVERRGAAAEYAEHIRTQAFEGTPFYYEPRTPVTASIEATEIEPTVPGVPSFTVQVIMASETDTKALIGGKVYEVGDEFEAGWIIAEIDGRARTVTIADPATSRSVTRAVRLPGED